MKTCPFCAEEIQDAAIVCKHCKRDLAATPAPVATTIQTKQPRTFTQKLVWAFVAVFAVGIALNFGSDTGRSKRVLNVSAARSALGFSLTNREATQVSHCRVTVLDQGNDEWTAEIDGTIDSYATVRVDWDQFKMNGHTMPSYVGMNRRYFTVNCILEDSLDSLAAGISF